MGEVECGRLGLHVVLDQLSDVASHLDAVHLWHVYVSQDQRVEVRATELVKLLHPTFGFLETLMARICRVTLYVETVLYHHLQRLHIERAVINYQYIFATPFHS